MLKTDLHMHTNFSKDCITNPEKLVNRCLEKELNCIAVTDHNSIQGALAVKSIAPFQVIIGEEIRTTDGEITGLFLREEIPAGLSPIETTMRIKEQGGLVSIPHPFDKFRGSVILRDSLKEVLPLADIIEVFNARNTLQKSNQEARDTATEFNLTASAVSDAHSTRELGQTYMIMPNFDGSPSDFLNSLNQATLICTPSNPLVHITSTINKLKRIISRH